MAEFELHPQLAADTFFVREAPLSTVLLMNDRRFPWLILVPRRTGVAEIIDLDPGDQAQLLREINAAARTLRERHNPDKLNIAALGNVVPQLHVHVVARFRGDAAWPRPVWGMGGTEKYSLHEAENHITLLNALADVN
jgi:diadenosine tetraphosphate (Ap4A) HIT family hydrolase